MVDSNHDELLSVFRLIHSENVGPKTFWNLIYLYKTATNALENVARMSLKSSRDKPIKVISKSQSEDQISLCLSKGIKILSYLDPDYPYLLKNIDDYPPILFCRGDLSLLNKEKIAIVGSRDASSNGVKFAYSLAKKLTDHNKVVVSGFARGIDSAAHKGSIDYATIAVLAGGVDHIYPPENKDLYYQLIEKGLVIAELPLGTIPKAQNFPQRNRIISGISNGVALIEASLKSGSLITAKFALQQNRDLFVVPGFPLDPHYHGNNYLLKQGAYLLESVEDILEVLNSSTIKNYGLFEPREKKMEPSKTVFWEKGLTQDTIEIIKLLGSSPSSIDDLVSITNLPVEAVLNIIVELELADKIVRHVGNQISIKL